MYNFPVEIIEIICNNLTILDIINLSNTCKKFVKLTINKNNILNKKYLININEIKIGFIDKHKLKYKKYQLYSCMKCGAYSEVIFELIKYCSSYKQQCCNVQLYQGVIWSSNIMHYRKIYNCFDCLSEKTFIHKKEKIFIIDFYAPQGFNRDEWYKKNFIY